MLRDSSSNCHPHIQALPLPPTREDAAGNGQRRGQRRWAASRDSRPRASLIFRAATRQRCSRGSQSLGALKPKPTHRETAASSTNDAPEAWSTREARARSGVYSGPPLPPPASGGRPAGLPLSLGPGSGLSSYLHGRLRLPQEAVPGAQVADQLPSKRPPRITPKTVWLVQPAGAI